MKASGVIKAALGVLVLFLVAGCNDDPLASGRGDVSDFILNPTYANVLVGGTTKVTAIAVNRHREETGDAVTAQACDSKVSVAKDPTRTAYEPPERFVVTGMAEGESCITVSAGGLDRNVTINVVPAS